MKKKTKIVLGSAMTMAMCASLIAGSTLALFTSEDSVNIAITSGKVDVEASVSALWTNSNAETDVALDAITDWKDATSAAEGGFSGEFINGGTATYTVKDGAGTLALTNISAGDAVKFTFSVTNNSNISIKYQIRMLTTENQYLGEGEDPATDKTLSSGLEVKLGEVEKKGLVYAASDWSPVITAADSIDDTEVIIRLPKDAGNEYQHKSCTISLSVLAVQGNAKETSYCDEQGHKYVDDVCIYCGQPNPFKSTDLHDETSDTYTIKGAPEDATELYIPGEINGKKVELSEYFSFYSRNHRDKLTSLTIGEGITNLPDGFYTDEDSQTGVFYGFTNLKSVKLPESLQEIGAYAFAGCSALQGKLVIPASVTRIGEGAFRDTGSIQLEFAEGSKLTQIDWCAFQGSSLTGKVTIPAGVQTIGRRAFYESGLTGLEFATGSVLTKIEEDAFDGSNVAGELKLPEGLLTIGDRAFAGCSISGDLVIPDSVTSIGGEAFTSYNWRGTVYTPALTSVKFGSRLKTIGHSAFFGQTKMESALHIPASVEKIESQAFYRCGITALTFGEESTLTTIGRQAFCYCLNLSGKIEIPDSVKEIQESAFDEYTFTGLNGEELSRDDGGIYVNHITELVIGTDSQLTKIGKYAFRNLNRIRKIVIPQNVTQIDESAFAICYRLVEVWDLSTSLEINLGESSQNGGVGQYAKKIHTSAEEESSVQNTNGILTLDDGAVNWVLGYAGEGTEVDLSKLDKSKRYTIAAHSFMWDPITSVKLGTNIVKMEGGVFAFAPLTSLRYTGDVDEWNTLHYASEGKGQWAEDWNADLSEAIEYVECLEDGEQGDIEYWI